MSEHHHNNDYLDVKQEEESRADQSIDDVVTRIETHGEQADSDYADEQEDYYTDSSMFDPIPIFAEQPALTDSVLGEEIDQEQPEPNSVSVDLSGTIIILPCSRRFDTGPGKFIAGTNSVLANFPNLSVFSASDITGAVMPPPGLYDDAGQVVLRNMASRPSGVLNTSILQGRDQASKDKATADKQNNIKHVKMFSQFENKQGSPKMSNHSFGNPAVVRTSVGLRYIAADDRAMLGRDAQALDVNIQDANWKYGKASSFPRLSLIDFPRPPVFGTYYELNNKLTKHAFIERIVSRPRTKPTEQGDGGDEQAATKKASKKSTKKSKNKAA